MSTKDDERRKRENAELIKKMMSGHNLCHTGLSAYRWAPRQIIEKDKKQMERVYGND